MIDYLYEWSGGRYRFPDISKLWRGGDDVADGNRRDDGRNFFQRMEPYLVRLQELSQWTDPQASLKALAAFHLIFFCFRYFFYTSFLQAAATLSAIAFVWHTWIHRIWPEIRVEETPEELAQRESSSTSYTPLSPHCLSAPEMEAEFRRVKTRTRDVVERLSQFRREHPGRFCAVACSTTALVAAVGAYSGLTAAGLVYILGLAVLVGPKAVKELRGYPPVESFFGFIWGSDKVDGLTEKTVDNTTAQLEGPQASHYYQRLFSDAMTRGSSMLTTNFSFLGTTDKGVAQPAPQLGLAATSQDLPLGEMEVQKTEVEDQDEDEASFSEGLGAAMPSPEDDEEVQVVKENVDKRLEEEEEQFLPREEELREQEVEEEEDRSLSSDLGLPETSVPDPETGSTSSSEDPRQEDPGLLPAPQTPLRGSSGGLSSPKATKVDASVMESALAEEERQPSSTTTSSEADFDEFEVITEEELGK